MNARKNQGAVSMTLLMALGLAIFLGWAAMFEIDQTVRAQGQIIPSGRTQVIQAADGGVLSRKGVVDYSIGKGVAPGVFVIAEMAHPRVRERMHDLKLGPGPYYTFYRPYHLTSLEVPLSCARAVLYHAADMVPLDVPSAEVCAVAKKDLVPGERLDAIGEYTYRAWIMTVADAIRDRAVPCGLLENGKTTKPIRKGELLTYDNCAVDGSARIVALRQRQDDMLKGSMT